MKLVSNNYTKNLVVGRQYRHTNFNDTIYLAVGKGIYENKGPVPTKHVTKHLVIIKCGDPKKIGLMVRNSSDTNWWDGIYPADIPQEKI